MDTNDISKSVSETSRWIDDAIAEKKSYEEVCKQWMDAEHVSTGAYKESLPDYKFVMRLIIEMCLNYDQEEARFLDLGGGYGGFTRELLAHLERPTFTINDISVNLLRQATQYLREYRDRFDLDKRDFFQEDCVFPEEEYEVVVSRLAIHYGKDELSYGDLYSRIYSWLKPGGMFLCWDHVGGENRDLLVNSFEQWKSQLDQRENPLGSSRGIIKATCKEDNPLSVQGYLRQLGNAGFEVADIVWRKANFVVYVGYKAREGCANG